MLANDSYARRPLNLTRLQEAIQLPDVHPVQLPIWSCSFTIRQVWACVCVEGRSRRWLLSLAEVRRGPIRPHVQPSKGFNNTDVPYRASPQSLVLMVVSLGDWNWLEVHQKCQLVNKSRHSATLPPTNLCPRQIEPLKMKVGQRSRRPSSSRSGGIHLARREWSPPVVCFKGSTPKQKKKQCGKDNTKYDTV